MDPARARPGLSPGLKALLISGYSEIPEGKHPWCGQGTPFLQKPFRSSNLAVAVREALGKTRSEINSDV